jgi:hypothetical protein
MFRGISFDAGTTSLLLAILWLDGWRRVPDDALVVRRVLLGQWRIGYVWARAGTYAFLSWWPPLVLPIIVSLTPDDDTLHSRAFDIEVARGRRRLRRVALDRLLTRGLATSLVVWIVFGIPILTANSGGAGLLRGVSFAFAIALSIAVVTAETLVVLGYRRRRALRMAAPLLSPFGAARAPELITEAAVADVSPMARLAALVGDDRFYTWIRPTAYDVLAASPLSPAHASQVASAASVDATALEVRVRALGPRHLSRAIAAPQTLYGSDTVDESAFCPRCGTRFDGNVVMCAECPNVRLRRC